MKEIPCPLCGTRLKYDDARGGTKVRCPRCSFPVRVAPSPRVTAAAAKGMGSASQPVLAEGRSTPASPTARRAPKAPPAAAAHLGRSRKPLVLAVVGLGVAALLVWLLVKLVF
jgi:hypothetical protein